MIAIDQIKEIPPTLYRAIQVSFLKPGSGPPIEEPSYGSAQSLAKAQFLYRNPLRSNTLNESKRYLSGWFNSSDKSEWPYLRCSDGKGDFEIPIRRLESMDLVSALSDPMARSNRFEFDVPFSDKCEFILRGAGNSLSLANLVIGQASLGSGNIYIDSIQDFSGGYSKSLLKVKAIVLKIYSLFLPWLLVIGSVSFVGLVLLALIAKSGVLKFALLPILFWVLYYSRLLLLTLIDVSSFPAVQSVYVSASFPLLIIASLSSILFFISYIKYLKNQSNNLKGLV
jgi:hypothetical protein